jgi:putative glycosyltransferase (TIGR04372 family)
MKIVQYIKKKINKNFKSLIIKKIKRLFQIIYKVPIFILAIPFVLMIRLIRPWLLVRVSGLLSFRIGHFAANTELYLCELDAGINVPSQPYIDIFFMISPVCNHQLAIMWKRILRVWPSWIFIPIVQINKLIPGGKLHQISTTMGRDIHNLYDRFPAHLKFTDEEELRGKAGLEALGLPKGAQFVCLNVRDSAYLDAHITNDWSYHNYRDSDIQNYVLAAEALANKGYYVIRMGAKVHEAINSVHPKVIDYATNGMRSDFMDIYLGAKCFFAISTGSGWDSIPEIQRRPIVYVNYGPVGYLCSFRELTLSIVKHHYSMDLNRELSFSEIFNHGVGFCLESSEYKSKGVKVVENTPEEIHNVVIEMAERLEGTWSEHPDDQALQRRFWEIFPTDALNQYYDSPLHGEIRGRIGANFLRSHSNWL